VYEYDQIVRIRTDWHNHREVERPCSGRNQESCFRWIPSLASSVARRTRLVEGVT